MRIFLSALLFVSLAAAQEEELPNRVKSQEASKAQPATAGSGILWLDPKEWTWVEGGSENVQTFLYLKGQAQARWIAKAEGGSVEALLNSTLERIRNIDHEARPVFSEMRMVNGTKVMCVQIRAHQQDAEVIYFGYLFADDERSHQLYTVSTGWTLSENYAEFNKLLDGLVLAGPESVLGR